MALPNVAPLLAKEFVPVKLDYDRGIGAKDVATKYGINNGGLPVFAFVDGDGKLVVNSNRTNNGTTGNIGHPFHPEEVAHFKVMLQKVKHYLTDADIETLLNILDAENKKSGG